MNFNALKSFCFAFTPRLYKLFLPHVHINNVPLVYVDSIKYLGFTFSRNHKDNDDMLRQMRTRYARSNRTVRIFHNCSTKVLIELGRSFCGSFYCSYLWPQYNKSSFSKICVAYNNIYRKILHVSPRSSASKMFVDNNIPNFEALHQKELFSFTSRLSVSTNSIIKAIENCWLIKYVIWKPCHIDKLLFNYLSCYVCSMLCCSVLHLGYDQQALPCTPPRIIEGGFIFFAWVSSATKIFS